MTLALLDRILARRRIVVAALAALTGVLALSAGSGEGIDRLLRGVRDSIRAHPASGQVHIVEIDSRSLREISTWPWPRRHHGALVDRLHSAGARSIAFDVDFSSRSTPADDAAFAAALARADGGVMLAVLRQQASAGSAEVVENVPIDILRDHAFLAAVNVIPDEDGNVRQMPLGIETGGVPRPSLAALLAEREAAIDGSFAIDYSIDPATIPRHSFADIVEGRVPASALRGKRILIGATAVEIGDRYAVPGHGVIPGVVIQALAAETLLAGPPPVVAGGIWPLLLAFALIAATIGKGRRAVRAAAFAIGGLAILALPLAAEQWWALSFPLAPALYALATAALAALGLYGAVRFRQRRLFDNATGLPNGEAITLAAADGDTAVVVARIDRFAAISAGIGPEATAALVRRIAERLGFGRDRPVYRIDEAHLAWIELRDDDVPLEQRLERLAALMRAPVECGRLIDVVLAFGVADPVADGPPQQVADAALAAERAAARGALWERFAGGDEEADWHLSMLSELDAALVQGHVWNSYQPKMDIATGRIVGVEALVRWDHPERGPIAPDRFIPQVEAHGRASDLTLAVLSRALEDAARWRDQDIHLDVAVNISATLLLDASFTILLEREIAAARLPADCVTLEVTESAAMKDSEQAIAALDSWRALGLKISIDDYGTGQSSLAYLQNLPATELKIDKSFVADLAANRRNAIMVRSTIAMAHELGMKVVAEGIEDAECLARLGEMGCDTAQGWHIGKPMAAPDIVAFLQHEDRRAA
ncbi:MAG TPA: EAL domain-containing protein [Allosphingosinicella sp.]|nr:EAL domain-containing protein [Allosphingosinicella sp.]